jgi:hypothetical protein
MTEQPEALRLADWLEDQYDPTHNQEEAAAELRRLHALNAELLEALRRIATVNAMDYEYQTWACAAIARAEGKA